MLVAERIFSNGLKLFVIVGGSLISKSCLKMKDMKLKFALRSCHLSCSWSRLWKPQKLSSTKRKTTLIFNNSSLKLLFRRSPTAIKTGLSLHKTSNHCCRTGVGHCSTMGPRVPMGTFLGIWVPFLCLGSPFYVRGPLFLYFRPKNAKE